jgi:acetaldehyde dehydrogenase / alcohol dehydrogenase
MTRLGFVDKILDVLGRRQQPVALQIIDSVEPEPSTTTVHRGAELMRSFKTDTIIALGGGSPMDAAKVMWLLYEHPEVNFSDLKEKFFDIRKRAFRVPTLGNLAQLVWIPTTSGTGAEVTPFAVITDPASGKKYPLADYALTPSVAIIDPVLTGKMPASLAADSGFDALTHATEAFVSVYANDFTDGMALQAIRLIFDNLAASVNGTPGAPETVIAREKMHNAGTIAGMAFGNAFLGIVHAMAHTIGATFHLVHGRTNATLLPAVIRYNGTVPTKLTSWPKYEYYVAPERFQQIAAMLGLPASTAAEGVESYAVAVEPAGQGGHSGLLRRAGRRRAGLHRPAGRAGDGRLPRPVRAGEPPHADARRYEGSDGRVVLRNLDRTGSGARRAAEPVGAVGGVDRAVSSANLPGPSPRSRSTLLAYCRQQIGRPYPRP